MLTEERSQFRLAERLCQAVGHGQRVIPLEALTMRAEDEPDIVLIAASGRRELQQNQVFQRGNPDPHASQLAQRRPLHHDFLERKGGEQKINADAGICRHG
jgi:hypothetical protein